MWGGSLHGQVYVDTSSDLLTTYSQLLYVKKKKVSLPTLNWPQLASQPKMLLFTVNNFSPFTFILTQWREQVELSSHSEWRNGNYPFWRKFTPSTAGLWDTIDLLCMSAKTANLDLVPPERSDRIKLWSWKVNQLTWSRLIGSSYSHGVRMEFLLSAINVRIPFIELEGNRSACMWVFPGKHGHDPKK